MQPIITKLAGVTHGDRQRNIRWYCYPSFIYDLRREADNPHDPNTIKVEYGFAEMGYLPTALAQRIAPLMDQGIDLVAEHVSVNHFPPHETVGLTVRIIEVTE